MSEDGANSRRDEGRFYGTKAARVSMFERYWDDEERDPYEENANLADGVHIGEIEAS